MDFLMLLLLVFAPASLGVLCLVIERRSL